VPKGVSRDEESFKSQGKFFSVSSCDLCQSLVVQGFLYHMKLDPYEANKLSSL